MEERTNDGTQVKMMTSLKSLSLLFVYFLDNSDNINIGYKNI